MNNSQLRMEYYLLQLERELQALPISQRSEAIVEVKARIQAAQDKDSTREMDKVLQEFGEPKVIAAGILRAKGMVPQAQARAFGPGLKWVLGGLLAFVLCVFLAAAVLIRYLTPLVEVSEKGGKITMFGGHLDLDKKLGRVKVGQLELNEEIKGQTVREGEEDFAGKDIHTIKIPFNTAKLEIVASGNSHFKWSCQTQDKAPTDFMHSTKAGVVTLDLNALTFASCRIELPLAVASEVQGVNGDVQVEAPLAALRVQMANGKVDFKGDSAHVYNFDVEVTNGAKDTFPSSSEKNAIPIQIKVGNGLVNRQS